MTPTGLAPPPHDSDLHDPALAETVPEAKPVLTPPPRARPPTRFFGPPFWISVGIHVVVIAAFTALLRFGPELIPTEPAPGQETVQYFDLAFPSEPGSGIGAAEAVEVEGASRPSEPAAGRPEEDEGALVAPREVPRGIPAPGGGEPAAGGVTGEEAGGGGVADRLRPGFRDSRLYSDPGITRMRQPAQSAMQRYQEHFRERIKAMNDSLYGASGPDTDWTVKDGSGNRWGIAEDGIHLGPITVPRALVPFPAATGTNKDLEEARTERQQREEIDRQEADRAVREAREESAAAARARREQARDDDDDSGG